MNIFDNFWRGLIILLVGLGLFGWMLYRWLRTSQDAPGRLIVKWILSGLIIIFILVPIAGALTTNGPGGAFLVPVIAVGGLLLAILWTPNIAGWVGAKFESLYTGGSRPSDPEPFYSKAQALRKRGHYQEAAQEVSLQLEQFPRDVTGQLLLAEIQAEDLKDLPAAQTTLLAFCDQPDHAPQNIWLALNTLADWHIKMDRNVEAAAQCLQSILDRLPDTPQSARAAQRIGHLLTPEALAKSLDRSPIAVPAGVRRIGLLQGSRHLRAPEQDPEEKIALLINQLEQHPLDTEAREQLASLYASHYHDLNLARDQLEFLLRQTTQPHKNKVRWLNLLADYQILLEPDYTTIQSTLQRIVDLNPRAASANLAQQRLSLLRLEIKGKEKSRDMTLGSGSSALQDQGEPLNPNSDGI